ncbi:MAG: hypothetical protein QF593_05985 [Nitrospinota bacterium]|jgi:hypothetical protein|nr:hypothetical protein [Nitrospinota bacterium]
METSQTTIEKMKLFEGKLVFLRREHSRYFHARTRIDGKRLQVSTKESTLRLAKEFATEWYLELLYKQKHNIPVQKHNFDDVVRDFLYSKKNEYRGKGERTEVAVNDYRKKCLVLS